MIHVTIKTKKIYSYDSSGMPKFETIDTTLQDGVQFEKFLKYLPYQNFIKDNLEIVRVIEDGKEIDKSKWNDLLINAVKSIGKTEPSLADKYEGEKKRNDELQERLDRLEKLLNEPKEMPKIQAKVESSEDIEALRAEYAEKIGKRAYHGWDAETLKQKINE